LEGVVLESEKKRGEKELKRKKKKEDGGFRAIPGTRGRWHVNAPKGGKGSGTLRREREEKGHLRMALRL